MPEQKTAADLMTKRFLRISTQHTLREAVGIILYGEQKKQDTGAIAIIDTEGDFAGILTPHNVVLGLTGDWTPTEESSQESDFLENAQNHMSRTVGDILPPIQPIVNPNTKLGKLIKLAGEAEYECLPVINEGRVEGLVFTTDIFKEAANIALTPETEGIVLE